MQLIGKTLGRYRIVEQIGSGGMAMVYKAYQPGLDRYVAVKVLSPVHAKTPEFKERFLGDAKAVAQLSHPHILPVYDVGIEDGLSYFVMKYVPGKTLKETMGKPLPLDVVNRAIGQVAAALDHAHKRGIIHRDVKPGNILVEDDWLLLTDFGIAKLIESSSALTCTGEILGTPPYMSPEQAAGLAIDPRSDIYSLGIILFAMVTGQVPFKGETPMGVLYKHVHEPLPLPRTFKPDLPEAIEMVIVKALAKKPEERYETAGQLADALDRAVAATSDDSPESTPLRGDTERSDNPMAADNGSPPAEPAAATPKPVDGRSHRRIAAMVLIVVAAALVAIIYVHGRRVSPAPDHVPIRISSSPPGADVWLDRQPAGQTPLRLQSPPGVHTLRLERAAFEPSEKQIRIEKDGVQDFSFDLRPASRPQTAQVPVAVPPERPDTPAQPVQGRPLNRPGASQTARAPRGAPTDTVLKLASAPGASVYIDGAYEGVTPVETRLPMDKAYTVRLETYGYAIWEKTLRPTRGQPLTLSATLDRQPPVADIRIDALSVNPDPVVVKRREDQSLSVYVVMSFTIPDDGTNPHGLIAKLTWTVRMQNTTVGTGDAFATCTPSGPCTETYYFSRSWKPGIYTVRGEVSVGDRTTVRQATFRVVET